MNIMERIIEKYKILFTKHKTDYYGTNTLCMRIVLADGETIHIPMKFIRGLEFTKEINME